LALCQTQTTIRIEAPNWQPWLLFFMRALQQQKRRLAVKVEREKNALAALPELAVKILDCVRDQGRGPRHDARHSTRVRRKPEHTESYFHVTGRKRPVDTPWRRAVHLVRIAMIFYQIRSQNQFEGAHGARALI
jgi:hypothetical protein